MDIDYSNTLTGNKARGDNDEKQICPLQLGTIERTVTLWKNERRYSSYSFLAGSKVYQSVKIGQERNRL